MVLVINPNKTLDTMSETELGIPFPFSNAPVAVGRLALELDSSKLRFEMSLN